MHTETVRVSVGFGIARKSASNWVKPVGLEKGVRFAIREGGEAVGARRVTAVAGLATNAPDLGVRLGREIWWVRTSLARHYSWAYAAKSTSNSSSFALAILSNSRSKCDLLKSREPALIVRCTITGTLHAIISR